MKLSNKIAALSLVSGLAVGGCKNSAPTTPPGATTQSEPTYGGFTYVEEPSAPKEEASKNIDEESGINAAERAARDAGINARKLADCVLLVTTGHDVETTLKEGPIADAHEWGYGANYTDSEFSTSVGVNFFVSSKSDTSYTAELELAEHDISDNPMTQPTYSDIGIDGDLDGYSQGDGWLAVSAEHRRAYQHLLASTLDACQNKETAAVFSSEGDFR